MSELQQFNFTSAEIRAVLVRASVDGDGVDGRALELVQYAHDIDGATATDCDCLEIIADIVKIWAEVSAGEIVGGNGDAERMRPCHKCGAELVECWNLAPIGASADNKHRIYADGVYLCDECHDVWATDYGIQPLDGE